MPDQLPAPQAQPPAAANPPVAPPPPPPVTPPTPPPSPTPTPEPPTPPTPPVKTPSVRRPQGGSQNQSESPEQITAILKQHVKQLRQRRLIGILLWILTGLVVLFLAAGYPVAKTGLLNVPVFSHYYYIGPQPVRTVARSQIDWETFRSKLSDRLNAQQTSSTATTTTYILPISEEELSNLFSTMAQQGIREEAYKVEEAQIAIQSTGFEILLRLSWHGFVHINLLAHMMPVLQPDGGLRFDATDATLGDMRIPNEWVRPLVSYLFNRDLGIWYVKMGENIDIQAVTLFDRSLQILLGLQTRAAP